tara:strand:- start:1447 stop:1656 length:210 start_codon:yes stop_codon:yes gene_type:complete
MTEGFIHASVVEDMRDGYTEYGYRGLEELRTKDTEIVKLKEEISELRVQLQRMENHANNLQAKASLPNY